MRKINLFEKSHPKIKRKIEPGWRKEENKIIAKRYDKEFFDGERVNGYGGYYYDGRWRHVVELMKKLYDLDKESAVLDIGCAKGFLLFDLQDMVSGIKVAGLDISEYALNHAMDGYAKYKIKEGVKKETSKGLEEKARRDILPFMIKGSADELPWPDKSFDVVLAINTLHNLPEERCRRAIKEMLRVGRNPKKMFVQVDAYSSPEEKEIMKNWVLTGETMMHVDDWIKFFKNSGYEGDYFWTII